MPDVLAIYHHPLETLGTIAPALQQAGLSVQVKRPYLGEPVPSTMEAGNGLILMGGPMSVGESRQYPFLDDERRLIDHALRHDKPILGICLGCQLLARQLGSAILTGEQELGWKTVSLAPSAEDDPLFNPLPADFCAFHWHSDRFALPPGAVNLARSIQTPHQAFRVGRAAYGILFHLEVTLPGIAHMASAFSAELGQAGISPDHLLEESVRYQPALCRLGEHVWKAWTDLIPR